MNLSKDILIIVPHPDDEILMCAGVIRRGLTEKSRVSVAVVTNGDYLAPDQTKGSRRLSESLIALQMLGMHEDDIYFLGYPDTGMEAQVSFLTKLYRTDDPSHVFSTQVGQHTYGIIGGKRDFSFARKGVHARYSKADFQSDLDKLIRWTKPQLIITSSRWDTHGDHSALFYFVHDAIIRLQTEMGTVPKLWESLIHAPAGDDNWPLPDTPYDEFTMPPQLEQETDLHWGKRIQIPLPEEMLRRPIERHLKYQAIQAYKSALNAKQEPEVARYLLAFAKCEELFWEYTNFAEQLLR